MSDHVADGHHGPFDILKDTDVANIDSTEALRIVPFFQHAELLVQEFIELHQCCLLDGGKELFKEV